MRKWLVFFLLVGILSVFATPAGAQGSIQLKNIDVSLWSEHDQPSMLVIHQFTLDPSTPLPAKVTVRFPKDANLTAVAYVDGGLITKDYDKLESEGSWQAITINVESYVPHRIEYYQPLTRKGNQRSFSYQWFGDYPVGQFSVNTEIPADSTNVATEPPFTSTGTSQDGKALLGNVTLNDLKMGQAATFTISYERQSESVSYPSNSANIQPAEPIGPSTEGRVSIDNLPWIIGGIGLVLIGLALFFYWRSTQTTEQKPRRRHRAGSDDEAGGEQAYCQECGARAHPGDRFCRTCGSKLRA